MKKKPYELTYEEFNNFRENNPEGDVFYHVARDFNNIGIDNVIQDIIDNGFKLNINPKVSCPNSISFFADKNGTQNFKNGNSQVVLFKMPKRAKFINFEDKEEFDTYINFLKSKNINISHYEKKEHLALMGYHGVTNYAHGGVEYRVYDEEILAEGMAYTNGHKIHVYNALKSGNTVPDEVLSHYKENDFNISVDFFEKESSNDITEFLKKKISEQVVQAKKRVKNKM